MSQHRQATIGTPFLPQVDDREFKFILSQFPSWARLKGKKNAIKCSCWDPMTGSHDPHCTLCDGSGYIYTSEQDRPIQCIMQPLFPHGRSGGADYVTQAGRTQRYEYLMYTYGYEWGKIVIGDTIIFPINDSRIQPQEYNVVNVVPHFGTHGNIVYITCLLWRKAVGESIDYPSSPQL